MSSNALFALKRVQTFADLDCIVADDVHVGPPVDARGRQVLAEVTSKAKSVHQVEYDPVTMTVKIGHTEVDADDIDSALPLPKSDLEAIFLESTTLGIAECFLLIESYIRRGHKRFCVTYVEPADYATDASGTAFDLSESIFGFRPIPSGIIDLSSPDMRGGVFFLGFEYARLDRAFEDHQMITAHSVSVVFGVPGFRPGWEIKSALAHVDVLKSRNVRDFKYCAADNPSAAYDLLKEKIEPLQDHERIFVAPLGTKPCGIGAVLFAAMHSDKVGLLYDHPRRKRDRSESIGQWHLYDIYIV